MPATLAGIAFKQNEEKRKPFGSQGIVHQDPHMNESRKFGWVDTNVRTITTDLPTLTILREPHNFLPFLIASWQDCQSRDFLGNGNFLGNASACLSLDGTLL